MLDKTNENRTNSVWKTTERVIKNKDFDQACQNFESANTLELQQNNKKQKPNNKKTNKNTIKYSQYRYFRTYANLVLTNRIKKKKQNVELPKPSQTLSQSIKTFAAFANSKLNGFVGRCQLCMKNYDVDNDGNGELETLITNAKLLQEEIKGINDKNVADINIKFEELQKSVTDTCVKIAKKYKLHVKQQQEIKLKQTQIRKFFKDVRNAVKNGDLYESHNRGGQVIAPDYPDIWEKCVDEFHNREFFCNRDIQFLDVKRKLRDDEAFAYYVTESSLHTPGALFCISVHRWKKLSDPVNENVVIEQKNEDNDQNIDETKQQNPNVAIPLYQNFQQIEEDDYRETDTEYRPLDVMDSDEWEDKDKLLQNSFIVIHIMDPNYH